MFVCYLFVVVVLGRYVNACTIVVNDCHVENQGKENQCKGGQNIIDTKIANQIKEIVALCEKQTIALSTVLEANLNSQMAKIETNLEEKFKRQIANIQSIITASQNEQSKQLIEELQTKTVFEVQPNMTNLALGKPAQQYPNDTNYFWYFSPSNAVDGKLDTFSHTTPGSGQRYWFVDLGHIYRIKRVEIYNRAHYGERLKNVDVTVGTSLQSMELCGTFKGPGQSGQHIVLECPKIIRGRYVKLTEPEPEWLHVAEVEVYGY